MEDVFEKIEVEDLTSDLQIMSDACGIGAVRDLLKNCAGMSFYIPRISRLESFIDKYMKENSAKKVKLIARELGVSELFLKNFKFRRKSV